MSVNYLKLNFILCILLINACLFVARVFPQVAFCHVCDASCKPNLNPLKIDLSHSSFKKTFLGQQIMWLVAIHNIDIKSFKKQLTQMVEKRAFMLASIQKDSQVVLISLS